MKRRDFLGAGAAALTIRFSLPIEVMARAEAVPDAKLRPLEGWLAIDAGGRVTVFTGKVELGTGVQTALGQLVAEELDVTFDRVTLVMGDTARCPDQFPTVGSLTVYRAGPQLRRAAAAAKRLLIERAAARLKEAPASLVTRDGEVRAPDGRSLGYGELAASASFSDVIPDEIALKGSEALSVVGRSMPRVELPGKVFGTHAYVHDLGLPGMRHGRVTRPPVHGAAPVAVNAAALEGLPGRPRLVRRGKFVGVVADEEHQAERAAAALEVEWGPGPPLPETHEIPALLRRIPATDRALAEHGDARSALKSAPEVIEASYYTPYQLHASIGPACAVADVRADRATLWSSTQSSFALRDSVAALLDLPGAAVRLIWMEGPGCYGQNGADDCTADAALLSQAAGAPVRVRYGRRDEAAWEPKGPAMAMALRGALDEGGKVLAWDYQVWSPNHIGGRPFAPGNLLAGMEIGARAGPVEAGADRNATCLYRFPNARVVLHLLQANPIRCSSLRGLGSPQNAFANESFMDELAAAAGADPIAFRLAHLEDPRAIAVLEEVAKISRWDPRPGPRGDGVGRGVAFVQYDNYSAYVATVVQVRVDAAAADIRVERVWVAHDCGMVVNPDGVRNQIEGNVIQNLSRALYEEARFARGGMENTDWAGYPIMRFSDAPQEIVISLIDRRDEPSLGAGEPAGSPVFAALANAVFDASGARLRAIPFTAARLRAALG
jgi:CO/xanthine dehydrogenase Mo-binding subunit